MNVNMIAAICKGRGMGKNGGIPWTCNEDMLRFKVLTKGQIVVMGGGTWRSLPGHNRPLKDRDNFIVTRNPEPILTGSDQWEWDEYSVQIFDCYQCAVERAIIKGTKDNQQIWCIGGVSAYEEMLEITQFLHLTVIERHYEVDRVFPEFEDKFRCIDIEVHPTDEEITFQTWERIK